jgi:hypothetical protein
MLFRPARPEAVLTLFLSDMAWAGLLGMVSVVEHLRRSLRGASAIGPQLCYTYAVAFSCVRSSASG